MTAPGDVTLGLVREALGYPSSPALDEQLSHVDPEALWRSTAYHRVSTLVHGPLTARSGLGRDLVSRYTGAHLLARAAQRQLLAELAVAAGVLDEAGVPWLILKGPALAEVVYAPTQLRSYTDLDILVRRDQFRKAVAAFEAAGFVLSDEIDWDHFRENQASEVQLRRPTEERQHHPSIDLHWNVIWFDRDRDQFAIPIDEIIRDARPVAIGGMELLTPNPCDTLLHVCVHSCLEGASRLVWLCDVDRIVAAGGIDWQQVLTQARKWRVGLPVGTVLLRAKSTLGTEIPPAVVDALIGSATWRTVLRSLDALFPIQRVTGAGTPATLVARTSRADVGTTLRLLVPRFTRRLWSRVRPEPDTAGDASGGDGQPSDRGAARSAFFSDFNE